MPWFFKHAGTDVTPQLLAVYIAEAVWTRKPLVEGHWATGPFGHYQGTVSSFHDPLVVVEVSIVG